MIHVIQWILLCIARPKCKHRLKALFVTQVQVLAFFDLSAYLVEFFGELCDLDVDLEVPYFLAGLEQLHDVGGIALDSLDSHVVVHALLHEGGVCEGLGVV